MSDRRPARRTNEERSRETRTRLLEAMVTNLNEVGYAAATAKLAIERAGVSRGAALHHFPSRVDLILETALYTIEAQNAYRANIGQQVADPRERLIRVLDVVWESWNRPHAIALLEIMIGARSDPELRERFPPIMKQIEVGQRERFWQLAKAAGITDRSLADRLVVMSASLMRGLAIERILVERPVLVDGAFELFKRVRTQIIREALETSDQAVSSDQSAEA